MAELRYTKSHEWCSLAGNIATCGITKHAADELNDLTFLDLRVQPGAAIKQGQAFGEIDSVKATSELFSPVTGKVKELNGRWKNTDELPVITKSAESDGWMVKIEVSDPKQVEALMTAEQYKKFCADAAH